MNLTKLQIAGTRTFKGVTNNIVIIVIAKTLYPNYNLNKDFISSLRSSFDCGTIQFQFSHRWSVFSLIACSLSYVA
jgi:hypothetical protein